MRGRRDLLEQLASPEPGDAWERARQWWLAVPAHLLGAQTRQVDRA
jgi:hypothetical protein